MAQRLEEEKVLAMTDAVLQAITLAEHISSQVSLQSRIEPRL